MEWAKLSWHLRKIIPLREPNGQHQTFFQNFTFTKSQCIRLPFHLSCSVLQNISDLSTTRSSVWSILCILKQLSLAKVILFSYDKISICILQSCTFLLPNTYLSVISSRCSWFLATDEGENASIRGCKLRKFIWGRVYTGPSLLSNY